MGKAQKGDALAYNQLLQELSGYIRKFCFQKVNYLNLTDDVVQECLIAVHKYRHTYDLSRPFLPWLHTIVKHKTIDLVRSKYRVLNNEVKNSDMVGDASEKKEAANFYPDLQKLLQQIPEDYRKPIEMLKIQELSIEEVAIKLNLTPSNVKVRVHRGLAMLKKIAEDSVNEEL